MKLLIVMVMTGIFLGLGLWQAFSTVHHGQESKVANHFRLAQEIK